MTNIKAVLEDESTLKEHIEAQQNNYDEYIANLLLLFYKYNVKFTVLKKARILAAALHNLNHSLTKFLLADFDNYDIPVVLKACEILDSRRMSKQLEKKLEKVTNKKKKPILKSVIKNLENLHEGLNVSLTKSKAKMIKKYWIKNISKEQLESNTITFSTSSWKKLVDMLHIKPTDFNLEWFSQYVFSGECPEGSITSECSNINKDNISAIISKYNLPFGFLKANHSKLLDDDVLSKVADYSKIDDVLCNLESFNKPALNEKIMHKINNEPINIPYGELMKRIQDLDKMKSNIAEPLIGVAQDKLVNYKFSIEQPVVILGDASSSMDVAIRTSSIIMSILCSICDAKMHLFRSGDEVIENPPTSVDDVIKMGKECKASGCTSPAASLYPYLENKEIVKTFILVTDEVENTDPHGKWLESLTDKGSFADIYKQYRDQVYPAKLVFVSFLESNKDGKMVSALKEMIPGVESSIIQFRLNLYKPDLRKLDILLDTLSMEAGTYEEDINHVLNVIKANSNEDKISLGMNHLMYNGKDAVELEDQCVVYI